MKHKYMFNLNPRSESGYTSPKDGCTHRPPRKFTVLCTPSLEVVCSDGTDPVPQTDGRLRWSHHGGWLHCLWCAKISRRSPVVIGVTANHPVSNTPIGYPSDGSLRPTVRMLEVFTSRLSVAIP